jgi:hypothetical protein
VKKGGIGLHLGVEAGLDASEASAMLLCYTSARVSVVCLLFSCCISACFVLCCRVLVSTYVAMLDSERCMDGAVVPVT